MLIHKLFLSLLRVSSVGRSFTIAVLALSAVSAGAQRSPDLPDAPDSRVSSVGARSTSILLQRPEPVMQDCAVDHSPSRACGVHWHQLIISSAVFNAFQNGGNAYTGYWYRYETTTGNWWDRYVNSVEGWHWNRWDDYNPVLDDYVGHPMMGGITNYLWIQNDPRSMTVIQSNTWPYWRRMLRAGAFSTAYSFQWKFGPLGEEGIGHIGDHVVPGTVRTNETGWVELVTTPVGGGLWTVAEDALDQHVITHLENESRNPIALLTYQFLNPARATANILRFRPPWYRDTRTVKANSFWSEPAGPHQEGGAAQAAPTIAEVRDADRALSSPPSAPESSDAAAPAPEAAAGGTSSSSSTLPSAPAAVMVSRTPSGALPVYPYPGGVHEFGAWWGLSLASGHIWGFAGDVKYMPIDVRYTYLILQRSIWELRYAPELTALAMLDQPVPGEKNPQLKRMRSYGSGLSPVGFQTSFLPSARVQPYLSTNGGFIYFDERVLSPQGSQWMYTIDFGGGLQIFRKARQSVSIGYRYQHLSNANISLHNPGTDANTVYVAVSRFRTKGYR